MAAPRSERTARDNARARALGYRDYYDFRLHDNGRRPPDAPLPPRGQRSELRGHRGPEDLLRAIRPGDVVSLTDGIAKAAEIDPRRRDTYREVRLSLIRPGEPDRTFTVRRYSKTDFRAFARELLARGAEFDEARSRNVGRM